LAKVNKMPKELRTNKQTDKQTNNLTQKVKILKKFLSAQTFELGWEEQLRPDLHALLAREPISDIHVLTLIDQKSLDDHNGRHCRNIHKLGSTDARHIGASFNPNLLVVQKRNETRKDKAAYDRMAR
jgi:hypothetical protein